jgi:hypothetical protein
MYWFDSGSGETIFEVIAHADADAVSLSLGKEANSIRAFPMAPCGDRWSVRLRLPFGLNVYAYRTGVRRWCEPGVGIIRTCQGHRFNLAVIPTPSSPTTSNPV